MGSHVFKRLSATVWLVAVAILLGLAGTSHAQLPIGSMVGEQRPTADVWWNAWRYDQAPRASYTIIAAAVSVVWLLGSFMIFKRLETGFADVS